MPEVASALGQKSSHAISWVDAMSNRLRFRSEIELAIAAPGRVDSLYSKEINKIKYFVFPDNEKDCWYDILSLYKPDIIHAYGTEKAHNLSLVKKYKQIPVLVSLQGILSEYQHHYYAGIEHSTMLRYISLESLFLKDGFFSGKRDFAHRSLLEKQIFKEAMYVEGRSTWDRVSALNINPHLKYFYCPRMIRSPFYKTKWDAEYMEPHSVFVHQGNYPIKGLHFVFEAIAKLKKKFPDIKLYIAGNGYFEPKTIKQHILQNGYIKYLNHLRKSLCIYDNIVFTGYLTAEALAEKLSKVNVVVIPSSIENAPNSLAEAELVGTPCIASFVGGNMDMLTHEQDGYLYCYNEPNMLAEYISRIFTSKEQAMRLSENARATSRLRHDPEKLENQLLTIYKEIINNYEYKK